MYLLHTLACTCAVRVRSACAGCIGGTYAAHMGSAYGQCIKSSLLGGRDHVVDLLGASLSQTRHAVADPLGAALAFQLQLLDHSHRAVI